jgi:hypothetical protein
MLSAQIRYKRLDPNLSLYQTPTQTLYWLNPWIEAGVDRAEIKKVSANAYLKKGDGIYFSRALLGKEFNRLCHFSLPMHYIIDDDYEALSQDYTIPVRYRKKMEAFAKDVLPLICGSDQVFLYAASPILAKKYGCVERQPHWIKPPEVKKKSRAVNNKLKLGFLSSASHLGDLDQLIHVWMPSLNEVLASKNILANVTHYLKTHIDQNTIPSHSHISWNHQYALPWKNYRHTVFGAGYDAILYPLSESPANQARSRSKWIEAENMGLPLFSKRSDLLHWVEKIDN